MTKKRIIILIPSFGIGGTNSSLQSFLSMIDSQQVSIDIFSLRHVGVMREKFTNCNILDEDIWLSLNIIEGGWLKRLNNFFLQNMRRICKRIGVDLYPLYGIMSGRNFHTLSYDAVCSFQEDLSHLLSCIPARKRIAWIRCEYERYYKINKTDESRYYDKIDQIVTVSQFTKNSFCKYYPSLTDKTIVINNFLDEDLIIKQSKQPFECPENWKKDVLKILSVGRIDPVKQFERIPGIVKKILEGKPDAKFVWIIIGSGDSKTEKLIEENIKENHLQNYIIRIPAKENIFPWMASSDLFVHTSKSETFSRVVNEAKALSIPVLINNYGCADEFVENGVDGWIVPINQMGVKITSLIDNPSALSRVKEYLVKYKYDNEALATSVMKLLE